MLRFLYMKKPEQQRHSFCSPPATTGDTVAHIAHCEVKKTTHTELQDTFPEIEHLFSPPFSNQPEETLFRFGDWREHGWEILPPLSYQERHCCRRPAKFLITPQRERDNLQHQREPIQGRRGYQQQRLNQFATDSEVHTIITDITRLKIKHGKYSHTIEKGTLRTG